MAGSMNAQQVAAKWARNLAGASQTIKDGVQAMTETPGVQAAAQAAKYLAKVQESVQSGKYQAGQLGYSLQSFKTAVIEKGIPNMQRGIQLGTPKMQAFLGALLPFTANLSQQVKSMPKGTTEDGVARAAFVIREMAKFKYSKGSGV